MCVDLFSGTYQAIYKRVWSSEIFHRQVVPNSNSFLVITYCTSCAQTLLYFLVHILQAIHLAKPTHISLNFSIFLSVSSCVLQSSSARSAPLFPSSLHKRPQPLPQVHTPKSIYYDLPILTRTSKSHGPYAVCHSTSSHNGLE